ncbi:MAG TPA: MFS transporter [Polyangia bacterium]|nr:MFS transporter [Polyangia bacterium]
MPSGSAGPDVARADRGDAGGRLPAPPASSPRALVTIVGWGVVATYLGWPQLLARLPLGLSLKNDLGLPPQELAAFWAVATIPWYLKPVIGLLVDATLLGGARRRAYLLLASLAASLAWLAFALVPRAYAPLLAVAFAVNAALAFVSTNVGGLLVELGQRHAATGRLSALRQTLVGGINLVAGPVGGWLAGRAFGWTVGLGALIVGSLVPVVATLWRAPAAVGAPRGAAVERAAVRRHLVTTLRSRPTLMAAALVFLVYVAPGLQTPLLYYQQDVLHFDPLFMGLLQTWAGAGVILGALVYGGVCRFVPLGVSLAAGIVLSAASTLSFLAYDSRAAAVAIHLLSATLGTLAVMPFYDLAARAAPRGSESFGYALVLGMQTLATYGVSDVVGSYLYGQVHLTFKQLVWVDALSTLAVLAFLPALPRALRAGREGTRA